MARLLCALGTALPAVLGSAGRGTVEVQMYRAMAEADAGLFTIENNDLASLVGVLKYVHTEVIEEHTVSPPDRSARKYSIDVIARSAFRVGNPSGLLAAGSGMAHHVDFGPYTTFDHGVATNVVQQDQIQDFGSFVGVQDQVDVRFPFDEPYYWFSVNGFCPNLPWSEKGSFESPNLECLNYTDGGLVAGGLCGRAGEDDSSGPNSQGAAPTGDKDCTYTYGNATLVHLDALVGILQEDCGGRRCTGWADFRRHCSNATYRRAFNAATGSVERRGRCVEYDIHPACQASCEAAACRALPEGEREVGIPFWRGRCDVRQNHRRAEQLAAAFGIRHATSQHKLGALSPAVASQKCAYEGGMCNPSPFAGGMYCSRTWAGVCQPCWIPGAQQTYAGQSQPLCPYDILESDDYRAWWEGPPRCASTRPRDLCCLYLRPSSCDPALTAYPLPLDEDGYVLAAAQQNTTVMAEFLTRVAEQKLGFGVVDAAGLWEVAYWEWGRNPRRGRNLAAAEAAMAPHLGLATTTTTAPTTTTSSASSAVSMTVAVEVGRRTSTLFGEEEPSSIAAMTPRLLASASAVVLSVSASLLPM